MPKDAIKRNRLKYRAITNTAGAIGHLFGRLEIHGRENLPARGPYLLVCNHLSHLDPPLLAYACRHYLFFMVKEELLRVPVIGPYLASIGCFPVKRGHADRAALRHALDILAAGECLAMFPEGHRSDDGRLQEVGAGASLIAMRAGVPIVPASITGTEKMLQPGETRLHRGKLHVRFGAPFRLDDLAEQGGRDAFAAGARRIHDALAALLPPEYLPEPEAEAR